MSSSEDRRAAERAKVSADSRANDPYAWIDRYAADLHRAAKDLAANGEASRVSDEAVAQIITAAVRLYYAKSELEDRPVPAIVQEGAETLTPTEMLVAVSEMLRDIGLGPMELGLWFRRRPGENDPGDIDRRQTEILARSKP
ncbi:MAG: hypothetical protein FJX62_15610 [Alphaproteobacteria bacterium]|nr:hypothetical protein [Alphaproteobacteria bacterium]